MSQHTSKDLKSLILVIEKLSRRPLAIERSMIEKSSEIAMSHDDGPYEKKASTLAIQDLAKVGGGRGERGLDCSKCVLADILFLTRLYRPKGGPPPGFHSTLDLPLKQHIKMELFTQIQQVQIPMLFSQAYFDKAYQNNISVSC